MTQNRDFKSLINYNTKQVIKNSNKIDLFKLIILLYFFKNGKNILCIIKNKKDIQ